MTAFVRPAAALLLLIAGHAAAANMTPVARHQGFCGTIPDQNAICHEWSLAADPRLHLVAYGYEDGVEYTFYRRIRAGRFRELVRIYPVMPDPKRAGGHVWAYAWDIADIEVDGRGRPLATFAHTIFDDGEVYSPKWQKRIPALLFRGTPTQDNPQEGPLDFAPVSVDALRRAAAHR
jgi:hypothetical protein